MRLTPTQQHVLIRDFLLKLKPMVNHRELIDEVDSLLQLPIIGGATQMEAQLEHLRYWQEWMQERENESDGRRQTAGGR